MTQSISVVARLVFRVLEDYGADCLPIQVAIAGKNAEPELSEQLLFNFLKIDKLTGDLVGIEKFRGGKNFLKTLAESALACGNSTRNSDCWHAVSYNISRRSAND